MLNRKSTTETANELVSLIKRRKLPIAMVLLASIAAAAVLAMRLPPKFEGEAKLIVTRTRLQQPVGGEKAGITAPTEISESELAAEIELINSRDIIERVVQKHGLADPNKPEAFWKAVRDFKRELAVAPVKKTNLISVRYRDLHPERAASIVNTILTLYLDKHSEVNNNSQASSFFGEQADLFRKRAADSRKRLADFEQKNAAALLDMQKESTVRRSAELDSAIEEVRAQRREAEERLASLKRQVASLPETVDSSRQKARSEALLEKWKTLALELEHKRTQLLTKFKPDYPLVREVERQIADTRQSIEQEMKQSVVGVTEGVNPIRQSAEAELLRTQAQLAGLAAREKAFWQDLSRRRFQTNALTGLTARHAELTRQVESAEGNLNLYEKQQEEARIAEAMDRERILNVSVLERAVPPPVPANQYRGFVMLLGAILGLFLGLGVALAADVLDPPMRQSWHVESATGRPVVIELSPEKETA